ncbi:hypothetical protein J6590_001782 [Homalodisca vitripennis]|nr:hypothetical protein J6590_001782 [Homalodisca vitripennis]
MRVEPALRGSQGRAAIHDGVAWHVEDVVGVCTKTSLRLRGAHNEDIRAGSQPLTARIANISDLRLRSSHQQIQFMRVEPAPLLPGV